MKLHWANKYALASLSSGELKLWIVLYLHSNDILRCYPSFETMSKGLGKTEMTLSRSIKGLEDKRAVFRVPQDLRMGYAERHQLSHKNNVYQLTGVVVAGKAGLQPIVFLKDETAKTIQSELMRLRPKYTQDFWDCWYKMVTNSKSVT